MSSLDRGESIPLLDDEETIESQKERDRKRVLKDVLFGDKSKSEIYTDFNQNHDARSIRDILFGDKSKNYYENDSDIDRFGDKIRSINDYDSDVEELLAPVSVLVPLAPSLDKKSYLKLLFCTMGLQVSYILWGIVQERMMTKLYKAGKFHSSAFCVFSNRVGGLLIASLVVLRQRAIATEPLKSALSNSISSWANYEALKYVSFPMQVLSKSCKIVPVMMLGLCINGTAYPLLEYLEATLIAAGAAIFTFSNAAHMSEDKQDSVLGIILIVLYLLCDSFTSQWQSRVFKTYNIDQYQMMWGVNFWGIILAAVYLIESGEGIESVQFVIEDHKALLDITLLALSSAVGQLFIFYTIKEFGPVIFTILMTTRQIISLVISCIIYVHPMDLYTWAGTLIVFVVVFNRIRRKGSD